MYFEVRSYRHCHGASRIRLPKRPIPASIITFLWYRTSMGTVNPLINLLLAPYPLYKYLCTLPLLPRSEITFSLVLQEHPRSDARSKIASWTSLHSCRTGDHDHENKFKIHNCMIAVMAATEVRYHRKQLVEPSKDAVVSWAGYG